MIDTQGHQHLIARAEAKPAKWMAPPPVRAQRVQERLSIAARILRALGC